MFQIHEQYLFSAGGLYVFVSTKQANPVQDSASFLSISGFADGIVRSPAVCCIGSYYKSGWNTACFCSVDVVRWWDVFSKSQGLGVFRGMVGGDRAVR